MIINAAFEPSINCWSRHRWPVRVAAPQLYLLEEPPKHLHLLEGP
jgi:hypothetical protein